MAQAADIRHTLSQDTGTLSAVGAAAQATEAMSEDARIQAADNIIKNHVIASMSIALVPVPLVDLVALTGIQLKMLQKLSKLYGQTFSDNLGKNTITSVLGGIMPTSTALTAASFAKSIPGLGTAVGMASVSVLGSAATYAIGKVFMPHFESGSTLLNFDPKRTRQVFAAQLKQGKEFVRKSNDKSNDPASTRV